MLAPQRARSFVSFLDKWKFSVVDQRRPKLHMFEHFHGARVYDGMFPDYQLPNGRKAFFCYESKLLDEVEVTLRECPEVPSTLSMALQVRTRTYSGGCERARLRESVDPVEPRAASVFRAPRMRGS